MRVRVMKRLVSRRLRLSFPAPFWGEGVEYRLNRLNGGEIEELGDVNCLP
jgi:hypothetical protein